MFLDRKPLFFFKLVALLWSFYIGIGFLLYLLPYGPIVFFSPLAFIIIIASFIINRRNNNALKARLSKPLTEERKKEMLDWWIKLNKKE